MSDPSGSAPRPTSRRWRATTFVAAGVAGALLMITGLNAHGEDLRASSVTDLATVVRQERTHTDAVQGEVATLNRKIEDLTHEVGDSDVTVLQRKVDRLKGPAGLTAVAGAGLTVSVDDAPKSVVDQVRKQGDQSLDELVVHQQDLQAIANALWLGGAEAMSIQGQRIVSTTGIKCVGNTVVLHGVPYSPPYRISAIGDPDALATALDDSTYVQAIQDPQFHLRYGVSTEADLQLPGYTGPLTLTHAKVDTAPTAR